jgi:hypothetical protein
MSVSRRKAWIFAEQVLDKPSGSVAVELRHRKSGVSLLHNGRVCYHSRIGRFAADFVALALGTSVPIQGESAYASVTTGVLFRAISIANLDVRIPEARLLIERLLSEAADQRRGSEEISV